MNNLWTRPSRRDQRRTKVAVVRQRAIGILLGLASLMVSGVGRAEELNYPLGVAAAEAGPIYLADRNLPGVWRADGDKLTVLFQASKKFRTPLNAIRCVALDRQGKLLVGDSATRDVYRMDDQNQPVPLTKGEIGIPMSIVTDKAGNLIVADLELHILWKVPAAGGKPEKLAAVPAPRGLAIDAEDRVWVVSHGTDQIVRVAADGKVETVVKGTPFQFPHNIALDDAGNAFVTDGYAKAVWKVTAGGEPQKVAENAPLVNPVGICRRGADFLIVDPRAKALFQMDAAGKLTPLAVKPASP